MMNGKMYNSADELFNSVTYIGYQKGNWGAFSGANGIIGVVPSPRVFLGRPLSNVLRAAFLPIRVMYINKIKAWYDVDAAYLETRVALDWMRRKDHIYHFLSGESDYIFGGSLKPRERNKVVGTFHSPINEFISVVRNHKHILNLDGAIVVAKNQLDFFSSLLGRERVWHVPLGVDVDYWRPSEVVKGGAGTETRVLFVGAHLRDFETLRKVIQITFQKNKSIKFDAVMSVPNSLSMAGLKNVTIHSKASDSELLRLYQSSDILVCPLLECTASLSILEGMACGLPMVVTNVGGVPDYVTPEFAALTQPCDAEEMTEALCSLAGDESKLKTMSRAARNRALEFDWRMIVQKFAEIYKDLLSR